MDLPPDKGLYQTSAEKRINLGLMALVLFYIIQIVFNLQRENICRYFAPDYCAFWSAGFIANAIGYSEVYDLNVLRDTQGPIYAEKSDPEAFITIPVPFFSVFILPFQLFALLDPIPGYLIWTFINMIGFIGYLRYFSRKLFGRSPPPKLSVMLFLSLPVFLNVFLGQVNLMLMIFVGEFVRAILDKRAYQAGLWLGGLLLKPQLLILIIPILTVRRRYKELLGFSAMSSVILLSSIGLGGFEAIYGLIRLWLGYTKGLPSNMPEVMMNWRMLIVNFDNFSFPFVGRVVAIGGILATIVVVILVWRKPINVDNSIFHLAFFGTLVATGLLAWHSHIATAMVLIPMFIVLYYQGQFPEKLFASWVFLPPAVRFIAPLLLAVIIQLPFLSADSINIFVKILNLFFGLPSLVLNIGFLAWSYRMFLQCYTQLGVDTM